MEEGTDRLPQAVPPAPSSSPLPSGSPRQGAEAASTSPPLVAAVVEEEELRHPHHHLHHHRHSGQHRRRRMQESITYHVTISPSSAVATDVVGAAPWFAATMRDDTWSCLVVLLTFWFFAASMTLILGFYGSVNLVLGPNSSRLLRANSYFVHDIKLQSETDQPAALMYGFSDSPPPLDVRTMWSETYNVSIPANFHKEWVYYLNEGSQIEVSYHVKPQGSSPLALVIAQGEENFVRWIEDPLFFMTTLSWNLINGTGLYQQMILKSSEYYIALGNLNSLPAEVELNIVIDALLYNTTRAYYNCSLHHDSCVMKLSFLRGNAAVLATCGPQQTQNRDGDAWYVKLSYGPRWIMYFVGSGLMSVMILLAFKILSYFCASSGGPANSQAAEDTHERTPLLSNKDDDDASLGSSYDSVSNDEGDIGEHLEVATKEPKPIGGSGVCDTQHLCTICCDARKDCFFLPCGHCATCFTCGTRVTEEAGTCPICRRTMKKVKRIFTV